MTAAVIRTEHRHIEVPTELSHQPAWLTWRLEKNPNGGKPLKIPYYCDGGRRAGKQGSDQDRARLTTFVQARDAATKGDMDGIGFALMPEWGITALDFDECVKDGVIDPEVYALVSHTYAEVSPSTHGIRAFVKGDLGNHKSHADHDRYGFETFASTGYVTVTGDVLPGWDLLGLNEIVADTTPEIEALCDKRFGADRNPMGPEGEDPFAGHEPVLGMTEERIKKVLEHLDPDMSREEWIRVGMGLHHEHEDSEDGFELWNDWSAQGGKYPDEEGLRTQWDSFTRRMGPGHRQVTMRSALKMAKDAGMDLSRSAQAMTTEDLRAAVEDIETPPEPVSGDDLFCTPEDFEGKFPIIGAGALSRRRPPPYFVQDVLPKADLAVVYGAAGSGKSFFTLDLGAAIARGEPWRGKRVTKGRVLIIAAEGSGGYGKRIKAYAQHNKVDLTYLDIGVITAAPNFMLQEDITAVMEAVKAAGGTDLIFVDTFAQVTPGANENSGEDMGQALAHAKVLREVSGATVVLIHHSGKDASRGARGWSGIKAAADAEIEVVKKGANHCAYVTKMKDGEDGMEFSFELVSIKLGCNENGDQITSCVVEHSDKKFLRKDVNGKSTSTKQMGSNQKMICLAAGELGASTKEGASMEAIIDQVINSIPYDPAIIQKDQRRPHVIRALEKLCDNGVLVVRGKRVYEAISAPELDEGSVP
jgi:hypothetical protein